MSVFVEQVGGNHYRAAIQHWDLMEACDVSYLEAVASKYIDRWRYKGTPLLDLHKAISYLRKMNGRKVQRPVDAEMLRDWLLARHHVDKDQEMLLDLLHPERGSASHVSGVIRDLTDWAERLEAGEDVAA